MMWFSRVRFLRESSNYSQRYAFVCRLSAPVSESPKESIASTARSEKSVVFALTRKLLTKYANAIFIPACRSRDVSLSETATSVFHTFFRLENRKVGRPSHPNRQRISRGSVFIKRQPCLMKSSGTPTGRL